ncbi:unnamed protein product [Phytomonas sp. Hart1]|nr:unnamed protein product [Phytomonas sp. Hart1]|eukprot:CCW71122.1 unnamed protein product [Phytomonas sp. isolate Hart1]
MEEGETVYCRSPTEHWWPLLLEKAYAKFYTLYSNLEGCTQQEVLHDFSGQPVIYTSMAPDSLSNLFSSSPIDVRTPQFWLFLRFELRRTVTAALCSSDKYGLIGSQSYAILDIVPTKPDSECLMSDLLVELYSTFKNSSYTGPMNSSDPAWTATLQRMCRLEENGIIYIPANIFVDAFTAVQQCIFEGLAQPSFHFNSEWGENTNGGNPNLTTWRNNPLYVVRNTSDKPIQLLSMVCLPDQRHLLHKIPDHNLNYPQVGFTLARTFPSSADIPTYLVTLDNHELTHRGLFFCDREVSDLIIIPPLSLCYLVPSCMYYDQMKFLLTYWYLDEDDEKYLKITRLKTNVARNSPATANFTLRNQGTDRLDFYVETPTDIHILLKQPKATASSEGYVLSDHYLNMNLYDEQDQRLKGSLIPVCYTEMSIVHRLPEPGRYAVVVSCIFTNSSVPCEVEAVGVNAAHVQRISSPANPADLRVVDLSFCESEPEGLLLGMLNLNEDAEFQEKLAELTRQLANPNADPDEFTALKITLNERCHEIAKAIIGKDRPDYLCGMDLLSLNPVLDANEQYMALERQRYELKKDPRNADLVSNLESELRSLAESLQGSYTNTLNIDFLPPTIEGIPKYDLPLIVDEKFMEGLKRRAVLLCSSEDNSSAVNDTEEWLLECAREIANDMHRKERYYLNPNPSFIPLELIPLNSDDEFCRMENELRELCASSGHNHENIKQVQGLLNQYVERIAGDLKRQERNMFLHPEIANNELIPYDSDEEFHGMEVQRLRLRFPKDADPNSGTQSTIPELEEAMRVRANELYELTQTNERSFLLAYDIDPVLIKDLLSGSPSFCEKETRLRELKKNPEQNKAEIARLQSELAADAKALMDAYRESERPKYLSSSYGGLALEMIPLNDDSAFMEMEAELLKMLNDPESSEEAIEGLVERLNAHAAALARDVLVQDRATYLPDTILGFPRSLLSLDDDEEFAQLEEERARILSDPSRAGELDTIEQRLLAHVEELMAERISGEREFLDPAPEGIPLRQIPFSDDPAFHALEQSLIHQTNSPHPDESQIQNLQDRLRARVGEIAAQMKRELRSTLEQSPLNVPLRYLPLDEDDTFRALEEAYRDAEAAGDSSQAERCRAKLNARARELAAEVRESEREELEQNPRGIPLAVLPLDTDAKCQKLEARLRALRQEGASEEQVADIIAQMNDRINEMAEEIIEKGRGFLDQTPEGVPLTMLPLDTDEEFGELEVQLATLQQDPEGNKDKIEYVKGQLEKRIVELAKEQLDRDLSSVDDAPCGIPKELLNLADDPECAVIIPKLRHLRSIPNPDASTVSLIRKLEEQLNDRANEIASSMLKNDRDYLQLDVDGVKLEDLDYDGDERFREMEVQRAILKAEDPVGNASAIANLERCLNNRAREMALDLIKGEMSGMKSTIDGIHISEIDPYKDKVFADLAAKLRHSKHNPIAGFKENLEEMMNDRLSELAKEKKYGQHYFLDREWDGVPLSDVPFQKNPIFQELWRKREELIARDPVGNADAIKRIEADLKKCVRDMACDIKNKDLAGLDQFPEGIPLALLHVREDPEIMKLIPQFRAARQNPNMQAEANAIEKKMNNRVHAMAKAVLQQNRRHLLGPTVADLDVEDLPLDDDRVFRDYEVKLATLQRQDSGRNVEAVQRLEAQFIARALEIAKAQLAAHLRELDAAPEGVPLAMLPATTDPTMRDLLRQLQKLQGDPSSPASTRARLRGLANARLRELAKQQKAADLAGLEPSPRGIPLALLNLHDNPAFAEMVDRLRRLQAAAEADPEAVALLRAKMDQLARTVAESVLTSGRHLLPEVIEHVPLRRLEIDGDGVFGQLELKRAVLQLANPAAPRESIAELDEALMARLVAMARDLKERDYDGLNPNPYGLTLALLDPHRDEAFSNLVEEKAKMGKLRKQELVAPIVRSLNELTERLAARLVKADRSYLAPEPGDIPLHLLPLDTDEVFRAMEVQRAVLKAKDPERNAAAIEGLERRLNDRAYQLSLEFLAKDRGYLDPFLEGVPLGILPLDTDTRFHQMEVKRAKLKIRDALVDADSISVLENSLTYRAVELAKKQIQEDLEGLDKEPEGYPIEYLHPHHHQSIAPLMPDLREAKQQKDGAKTRQIQDQLNRLLRQIAKQQIVSDREFLDRTPEGVPIELLDLEADSVFREAEKNVRALQSLKTRQTSKSGRSRHSSNRGVLKERKILMNTRIHEMAKELIYKNRGFLNATVEGIPVNEISLDNDHQFRELEIRRLRILLSDPATQRHSEASRNTELRSLEEKLTQRAGELARSIKHENRRFLRRTSFGVPWELLPLDSDKVFVATEKELQQKLKAGHSTNAVPPLYNALQKRADQLGEEMVKGQREKYLDLSDLKVEIEDLNLDNDDEYSEVEVRRAILLAEDPYKNHETALELETKLNDRAHFIARELIRADRSFLPKEFFSIPTEDLPLDESDEFIKLERQYRAHRRTKRMDRLPGDEELLKGCARELAAKVLEEDLSCLKDCYRGIPKKELHLPEDPEFRTLACRRRNYLWGKVKMNTSDVASIEKMMDSRASDIADDILAKELIFLDREPEGMLLEDVPLDTDPTFIRLEAEYRRRSGDPRLTLTNKEALKELQIVMNQRSHALAAAEFAKRRAFMDQEPEGIPLSELCLDEDPEFKAAEITNYRNQRLKSPRDTVDAETRKRMNQRAHEVALVVISNDRAFLDPEPEGIPLKELLLEDDRVFQDLAVERRRLMKSQRQGNANAKYKTIENQMNQRTHELARAFLKAERKFLNPKPAGVPISDLPLNSNTTFRILERERRAMKAQPNYDPAEFAAVEAELNDMAHKIALSMLVKERMFLNAEPMGVQLEELSLNHDDTLNSLEHERRGLLNDRHANRVTLNELEDAITERVNQIADEYLQKEREFLDPEPEGVPLKYLPLSTDPHFHNMELQYRKLNRSHDPEKVNLLTKLRKKMQNRTRDMARELVNKSRAFLDPEPLGVLIADLPLNYDETFRKLEEQRRVLKENDPTNVDAIKNVENLLKKRTYQLAVKLHDQERSSMTQTPLGIPLEGLPLNEDRQILDLERVRRQVLKNKDSKNNLERLNELDRALDNRALELAVNILKEGRAHLDQMPYGVPIDDLELSTDLKFHGLELELYNAQKGDAGPQTIAELHGKMTERLYELVDDFVSKERYYLDPEPEGVPLSSLPINTDPLFLKLEQELRWLVRNKDTSGRAESLRERIQKRVYELALEIYGWKDVEFHDANKHVAPKWPRIADVFPENRTESFLPKVLCSSDVGASPHGTGYLASFIAALARYPTLLLRLFGDKTSFINAVYTFTFFDFDGNPTYISVDDRVPCGEDLQPLFLQSSNGLWYPLLLEKAYAKFIGGYDAMRNCSAQETIRDLTGRPVVLTPLEPLLANAGNIRNCTLVDFWHVIMEDLASGNIIVCLSKADGGEMDGIHPMCYYPLLGVIKTVEASDNPSDIIVKIFNVYHGHGAEYNGPLNVNDLNWTPNLRRICKYDPQRNTKIICMPLPTFLRNFCNLYNCYINCGTRMTVESVWDRHTAGGNPSLTTFRNNPIFILEKKASQPVTVLVELRRREPSWVDEDGSKRYSDVSVALLQPVNPTAPPTPLLTNSTHSFVQKGIMMDTRDVCMLMVLPSTTSCYLIPYNMNPGQTGSFTLSVYSDRAKLNIQPLKSTGLSRTPTSIKVVLCPGQESIRIDFTVSSPGDVHVLLHQEKITEVMSVKNSDIIAEDSVSMAGFTEDGFMIACSGESTNSREHSMVMRVPQEGRYAVLLSSPNPPFTGNCPCLLSFYTFKWITIKFVPTAVGVKPLQIGRRSLLPKLSNNGTYLPPRTARTAASSEEQHCQLPSLDQRRVHSMRH